MKVLLVLPAATHLRVTDSDQPVPRRNMLRFSILPLTTVAALTPPPHTVAICDENVEPLDFDTDADLIGVSFMTATAPRAFEIAREFRRHGKLVVAGGFHPTLCPDETAPHFDAVVLGDAEGIWPQVLADASAGKLQRTYRAQTSEILSTPVPRRDLIGSRSRHYATTAAVQTGRGCRHSCRYCSITAFHNATHRSRPLAEVLDELRAVPRHFMFVDDNIIADPDYARALFRAMVPLRKRWITQCSIEIADDPELLALARRAGCIGLFIGIESIRSDNLQSMNKDFNDVSRVVERIRAIRRARIGVQAGIILGLDADDRTVFQRTLRFLQKNRIGAVQVNILTPLPGTPLFESFRSQGRILDFDWSHYDFRHVVIRPWSIPPRELQEGADWLYAQFYRIDRIMLRTLRALFTLGPLPAILVWRLNLTYRYDNLRERVVGRNPARKEPGALLGRLYRWWTMRMEALGLARARL